MHRILLVIYLLFNLTFSFCKSIELPMGWRDFNKKDILLDWRKSDKNHFLSASGDYNGDGKNDMAKILVSKVPSRNAASLFVFLFDQKGDKIVQLISDDKDAMLRTMGIKTLGPQKIVAINNKHKKNIKTLEITTKHDSLVFFANEGASSIFYWNGENEKFERFWISD